MSSSICCFLACIQVSQETGKVVSHFHLFKNFPLFWWSTQSKALADVFLEFPCFFYDSVNVVNLISGSSDFSKFSMSIWKFSVLILLKPGLENFEHYFASMWDDCNCVVVEHSLTLPFFGIGMEMDLFHSWGHFWVFQICWHIECSTFTALSFRTETGQLEFHHLH